MPPQAPLTVTWTRPAELLDVIDWNWQKFSVDVGFHTKRRVLIKTGRGVYSSPEETHRLIEGWYESHTDLVIRTTATSNSFGDLRYTATVQGKSKVTGQRDDLMRDIEAATRKHKSATLVQPLEVLEVDWTFPAAMTRLVDGDTQEFQADVGFHTDRGITMRLLGVNCPETKGPSRPAGLAASEFSRQWYETHTDLVIQTRRDVRHSTDAFRRYLVTVEGLCLTTGIREDLAQSLLGAHHAVPFMVDQ